MRLLVIVDTYVPARISGALQMRDLVHEMLAQGHSPTVIVPAPELNAPWRLDEVDGVEVLRIKTLRTKDIGRFRRVIAEWWLPFGMLRGLRCSSLADTRWEGLVWYSPTIFFAPLIHALKKQWRCPGYLILRDLFPDWTVDAGILRKGMVYRWLKRVERQQYALADVVGVQTPANAPLVRVDSPDGANIEVMNNWLAAPATTRTSVNLADGPLAGRKVFAYTGNMGVAQHLDCMIDVAMRLRDRQDIGFLFVGRGSEAPRLRSMAEEHGLDNVQFIDEIDADQIPGLLAQCHVGLIALDPRHSTHNIPGKLLTYLHAGLPILARINRGNDLEELMRSEGIGFVIAGDDQERLAANAEVMADDSGLRASMAGRGRELALRLFAPESAVKQVIRGLRNAPDQPATLAGGWAWALWTRLNAPISLAK